MSTSVSVFISRSTFTSISRSTSRSRSISVAISICIECAHSPIYIIVHMCIYKYSSKCSKATKAFNCKNTRFHIQSINQSVSSSVQLYMLIISSDCGKIDKTIYICTIMYYIKKYMCICLYTQEQLDNQLSIQTGMRRQQTESG